jgi:predicted Zn-dependent protease
MGKKKKRRSKQRKQAGNTNLPLAKVLSDADWLIRAGKVRDAIALLKAALKNHPADEKVRNNLYHAYQLRKQQLLDKDMVAEASVVENNAIRLLPEPDSMTEVEMLILMHPLIASRKITADRLGKAAELLL